MLDNRIINSYRELSLNLSMCNTLLKAIHKDLKRIEHPCKHRNILLHEKLQLQAMKTSIKASIRSLIDNIDFETVKKAML